MLPKNLGSFWYWQTDRKDTLWYPGVHVLRQRSSGDWGPVIEQVCAALPATQSPAAKVSKNKTAGARKTAVAKSPPVKKTTVRKQAAAAKAPLAKKASAARKKKIAAK